MKSISAMKAIRKGKDFWNDWYRENNYPQVSFEGEDLHGLNLYYGANLQNIDFSYANLSDAILTNANFKGSNFSYSNLEGANLLHTDCRCVDFSHANLKKTDFREALVDNANMSFSNLTGSAFHITSGDNLDIDQAVIVGIDLTPLLPGYNASTNTSFFELLMTKDICAVSKDSQEFILKYIKSCFFWLNGGWPGKTTVNVFDGDMNFIEERTIYGDIPEKGNNEYFKKIVNRSNGLIKMLEKQTVPTEIITITKYIDAELIKYLKAHPKYIYQIHWRAFEELIAEILTSFGWSVELTAPSKDGGYDIIGFYKDLSGIKHNWIIECKKWDEQNKVGVDVVRALYGVKTDLRVGNAMLATTSFFTDGVDKFKSSHYDFETKDFNGIIDWVNEYKLSKSGNLYISDNKLKVS